MRILLRLPILIATPLILIVLAVRLLNLPWYPAWVYNQPDFPPDYYGMAPEQRLKLAQASMDFLNAPYDLNRLKILELEPDVPAYNERELSHMADVKQVFDGVTLAAAIVLLIAALTGFFFVRKFDLGDLWGTLSDGGLIGLGLLLLLGIWMIIGWDGFFVAFHQIFFKGGTWIFEYTDTLIRLFPQPFWETAGKLVAGSVGGLSFLMALIFRMLQKRWEWKRSA